MRQNAFNQFRFVYLKLIFHWVHILFHVTLVLGTITVLLLTFKESFETAVVVRIFLGLMAGTSIAHIFLAVYERRWPLVSLTEWDTEIVRPINTSAGKFAMFLKKNLDSICFLATIFMVILLDKESSKDAAKESPLLYTAAIIWIAIYFLYFVMPVFFILALIACLPCIIIILQRFFNFSLNPQNQRAAPATQEILQSVWRVKYTNNEAFKYINPENLDQSLTIPREDTKCSICLGWYENGDELRILACSHHFHLNCVDEWLKITATCPLCVRSIVSPIQTSTDPVNVNVDFDIDSNV